MQTAQFFNIDLSEIEGKGEFKCPKCGAKISPDDTSEKTYIILETHMKGDSLEKIRLQCNKCQSQIYLTGFYLLNT